MSLDTIEPTTTHATGPKTPEGKIISSGNSWKHGVYSRYRRFRTQAEADHWALLTKGFFESWNPKGEAECAAVHTLSYCQFWRLKFQAQESCLWNSGVDEMMNLQVARGEERDPFAAEPQSLICHGEHEKELARRKRSINSEYNKAYRELTHLQRIRRQEAALKAKQSNEATRVELKAEQESADRATPSNEDPDDVAEFVSANCEILLDTDL